MADRSKERWNELPGTLLSERLSFVPGTDRKTFDAFWREMQPYDQEQVSRIMRHDGVRWSPSKIVKFTSYTGWTGRLVLRNKVSIIGVYLAEHLTFNAYNDIKYFWVHPDYHAHKVPLRLLQLARLELPEFPTRVSVSQDATELHNLLRQVGWSDVTDGGINDSDPESAPRRRRDFRIQSVAEREYRETLEAGRVAREPTARPGV